MALSSLATSLKQALNRANPNSVPDMLRSLGFGDFVRSMPATLRQKAPAASPYNLATVQALSLPDDAHAEYVFSGYGRVGTATAGPLTPAAQWATPLTGQIAVSPSGDLVVLAADAWTSLDVCYLPEKSVVLEETLPVVANVCTLPSQLGAGVTLMEAESLTGGVTGKFIVTAPAGVAAAGHSCFSLNKLLVRFAGADAVTSCRIKYSVPSADMSALLEAVSNYI